ncbi:MAG: zinc ribbon domain-containing protein [Proteobacteria bacterium]|jgi:hypothetical protein|nr:zinc ribbon domain-containing protein [Pseudomonadota bacterium]
MLKMMSATPPFGSSCQSCAASILGAEDQGTNEHGRRVRKYCRRCYRDGRFVEPELTAEGMVLRVTTRLSLAGMIGMVVANEVAALISGLDRWQGDPSAARQA